MVCGMTSQWLFWGYLPAIGGLGPHLCRFRQRQGRLRGHRALGIVEAPGPLVTGRRLQKGTVRSKPAKGGTRGKGKTKATIGLATHFAGFELGLSDASHYPEFGEPAAGIGVRKRQRSEFEQFAKNPRVDMWSEVRGIRSVFFPGGSGEPRLGFDNVLCFESYTRHRGESFRKSCNGGKGPIEH